jgi:hypothetical protein
MMEQGLLGIRPFMVRQSAEEASRVVVKPVDELRRSEGPEEVWNRRLPWPTKG